MRYIPSLKSEDIGFSGYRIRSLSKVPTGPSSRSETGLALLIKHDEAIDVEAIVTFEAWEASPVTGAVLVVPQGLLRNHTFSTMKDCIGGLLKVVESEKRFSRDVSLARVFL